MRTKELDEAMRGKLKELRNRLSAELPVARLRPSAPPELVQRMESALEMVAGAYLLSAADPVSPASASRDELYEDAVAEGHLALHDWERCLERESRKEQSSKTPPPIDRRVHQRHDINVTVKLLRHRVRADEFGEYKLDSETTSRPARNVSLGGILVAVLKDDLPQVGVGSVLHLSVSFGAQQSFQVRATVQRRDAQGLGLRWIVDSDRAQRAIESLLEAISRARRGQ